MHQLHRIHIHTHHALISSNLPQVSLYQFYNEIINCNVYQDLIYETHTVAKGIRQGCPLSFMIYVVALEALAIKMRNDTYIRIDGENNKKRN